LSSTVPPVDFTIILTGKGRIRKSREGRKNGKNGKPKRSRTFCP
jgi:hypothetical protein